MLEELLNFDLIRFIHQEPTDDQIEMKRIRFLDVYNFLIKCGFRDKEARILIWIHCVD